MAEDEDPMNVKLLAQFIKSDACNKICFLTGAGVSVAAGIPDFRSPGGMYSTLDPDKLTATEHEKMLLGAEPSYAVSWHVFKDNQLVYLELRRPFILGCGTEWKPTIAHVFQKLCEDKGFLRRVFTQNIDGLDFATGISKEKIVTVHGNLAQVVCETCKAEYPLEDFRAKLRENVRDIYTPAEENTGPEQSQVIPCLQCKEPYVKPNTVLFGRNLPKDFFQKSVEDFPNHCDLLIIAGTSLVVSPANGLVKEVSDEALRFVINLEPVNQMNLNYKSEKDILGQGTCDEVYLALIRELGWYDDLVAYMDVMNPASQDLVRNGAP